MRFVSIASGSSGNCIYVGTEKANILVDAGISNKRIEQGLNEIGVKGSELSGIVITHEHSDHVRGLGVLARKHGVPIYGTAETLREIQGMGSLGKMPGELFHPVLPEVEFSIGALKLLPFSISSAMVPKRSSVSVISTIIIMLKYPCTMVWEMSRMLM